MFYPTAKNKTSAHFITVVTGVFTSLIMLLCITTIALHLFIQHNNFSKWVKEYLEYLMARHPKNSMLRLFSKNIEKTVSDEYLISYIRPVFMGGIAGVISAILILLVVQLVYYHNIRDKTDKKTIRQNITENFQREHLDSFLFFFSFVTLSIASAFLVAVKFFIPNDVPSMLCKYVDNIAAGSEKNAFIRVFKGIVSESFKAPPQHDLIAQIRSNIVIISSIFVIFFGVVAIMALCDLLYMQYKMNKQEITSSKKNDVPSNQTDLSEGTSTVVTPKNVQDQQNGIDDRVNVI